MRPFDSLWERRRSFSTSTKSGKFLLYLTKVGATFSHNVSTVNDPSITNIPSDRDAEYLQDYHSTHHDEIAIMLQRISKRPLLFADTP